MSRNPKKMAAERPSEVSRTVLGEKMPKMRPPLQKAPMQLFMTNTCRSGSTERGGKKRLQTTFAKIKVLDAQADGESLQRCRDRTARSAPAVVGGLQRVDFPLDQFRKIAGRFYTRERICKFCLACQRRRAGAASGLFREA